MAAVIPYRTSPADKAFLMEKYPEFFVKTFHILLKLHKGYGLGDSVMMSVVLQHLAKYRPHWQVEFVAECGKHSAARGLCHKTWTYDDTEWVNTIYDLQTNVYLFDNPGCWIDRPCTRAVTCLHEMFGILWRPELGRYKVCVSKEAEEKAEYRLLSEKNSVLLHFYGKSAPLNKNLSRDVALGLIKAVRDLGLLPVLLNWRDPVPEGAMVLAGEAGREKWPTDTTWPGWGGDAEHLTAVIAQARAFIGIDSGPAKCASATDTPALVYWTDKHHPLQYHDPAPNTTHLLPWNHDQQPLLANCPERAAYFAGAYRTTTYAGAGDIVPQAAEWLKGVIK